MSVVFLLTAVGLVIVGVPLWLSLTLIEGLFKFMSNFGPVSTMIPAVLSAILQGPATAGIVACIYILIQVIERNLISPLAQQRLAAFGLLIIIAQLIIATFSGGWELLNCNAYGYYNVDIASGTLY